MLDEKKAFDWDGGGALDLDESQSEKTEMLLAVATGVGFLPVHAVLEEGSLHKIDVDRESAMIAF